MSNKKIPKRFSNYLLFKKLKPHTESDEYQAYVYNKKSSKITEKKKISKNSNTLLSFV